MESLLSLSGIGELAQPITKLIDTLAAGAGRIYAPTHTKRMAKAEADASVVIAEGEVAADTIRQRANLRQEFTEERRQINIEAIVDRATKYLPAAVSSDPVDPDWTFAFVEESKDTGNADLQELWAKILANELVQPGRCSKRTLRIVKTMDRADAAVFAKLASLVFGSGDLVPFILTAENGLQEWGIQMQPLHELAELGLIIQGSLQQTLGLTPNGLLSYFSRRFIVSFSDNKSALIRVPFMPFTLRGQELLAVCQASPEPGYLMAISQFLRSRFGVILTEHP